MSANKSQRFSISGRNLQFLKTVAEQMDETDLSAALSYLLTDVRCLGWRVGDKPAPQPITQAPLGYSLNAYEPTPNFEADRNQLEETFSAPDPLLERLIAAGLDMEF